MLKMTASQADKQRVYLTCRVIFTGQKALLRKQKKVREEVSRWPQVLGLLIRDLGIERVVAIICNLLEQRIFESEVKAKVEFPGLFQSSREQDIRREASEVDAAKSTAEALDEAASTNGSEPDVDDEGVKCIPKREEVYEVTPIQEVEMDDGEMILTSKQEEVDQTVPIHEVGIDEGPKCAPKQEETDEGEPGPSKPMDGKEKDAKSLPSLYPILVPYKAQHLILNEAQRILEESCFEFAKKWMPLTLEKREWDCARSGELTGWTRFLASEAHQIPEEAFSLGGQQLSEVLFATDTLRHSAVHRLPTTARGIMELIRSGITMASALRDIKRAAQLEVMCDELGNRIKSMEMYKNTLENTAMARLEDIQRQREELDQQERAVLQGMLKDDAENKALVGILLEKAIGKILLENSESAKTENVPAKDEQWISAEECMYDE